MAEFKATKAAFVGSLISLLLSCAMLLGTTFAWFTDAVSSSNNRILAGNLDIDLLMYKSDEGEYVSIAKGNGDIFAEENGGRGVSWEPGITKIAYLAVQNIGSLALKYNIKLDVDGELADALEYAILDGKEAGDATATSWNSLASSKKGRLTDDLSSIVNGELYEGEDTHYFAVAVHMPDDASNEYRGASIAVDLTVVATQSSYEKDSFGDGYDADGDNDESEQETWISSETAAVTIDTIEQFKKFTDAVNSDGTYDGVNVANNPDVYVKLTDDIDLSEYTDFTGIGDGESNSFDGVFDGCDYTIKNWTVDNQDKPLALFRTTKNARIKNLTIDNFIIGADTTNGNNYSVLIGLIEGDDVVIDKVSIKNSVLTGQETMGVIVGAMSEGQLTITNCNVEDITIKNAEGYTEVVGILIGSRCSENNFAEAENKITNVKWFNADTEQTAVPAYNYTEQAIV